MTDTLTDTRKATCWLTYPHTLVPDPYKPLGPNLLGEHLWPVEVTHGTDGSSRVGFSLIAPPGVNPFTGKAGRA